MVDPARPGHFGDVDEAFDTLFEFHERAVRHDVDHFAHDFLVDRVFLVNREPRGLCLLLESERDPAPFLVELEDHDLDLLIDLQHIRRMADTSPGNIGDMEKTVDAAEVDESAEVGDVLDYAGADLTLFQFGEDRVALLGSLLLDKATPGDDDVHPRLVDLDDLALEFLVDVLGDILRTPDRDL